MKFCISIVSPCLWKVCLRVTATPAAAEHVGANRQSTITEEMFRTSLLSAVEDKVRRRLREVFDQAQVGFDIYVCSLYTICAIHCYVTQPATSKHWTKVTTLSLVREIAHWPHPFFIHHHEEERGHTGLILSSSFIRKKTGSAQCQDCDLVNVMPDQLSWPGNWNILEFH